MSKKDFMNRAQWDHKYDDCGLTLHFKVDACGVYIFLSLFLFFAYPSIFELSAPGQLANLQIEVSLSHASAYTRGLF